MNLSAADFTAALRRHDPAPDHEADRRTALTPLEAHRAEDTLRRILATDLDSAPPRSALAPIGSRRRPARRWVVATLGTVAVAAAVVVPAVTTGGDKAYASWSAFPVSLSPVESAAAARACLGSLSQKADPRVKPLLAERRGAWTYVLVRATADIESSCIMPTEEIDDPVRDRPRWFGATGDVLSEPPPRADELRVLTEAIGSTKEGLFSYSEGEVGRDVVDVTFTTPRGVTVKASVAGGRCAVWWPAGKNYLRSPEISEASAIDITLTDGTTYHRPR